MKPQKLYTAHGTSMTMQVLTLPTVEQRRAGVVSNFKTFLGTGGGRTEQERTNIDFHRDNEGANCIC